MSISSNGGNIESQGYGTIGFNKVDSSAVGSTVISGYSPLDTRWEVIGNNNILDSDRLNPTGWGFYVDDNSSGSITAGSGEINAVQFSVNGLAANNNETRLPRVIRGTNNLWDTSTNSIKPITVGDTYDFRISFNITATSSNPSFIAVAIDIGAGAFPSNVIYRDTKTLRTGGLPARYSFSIPSFTFTDFVNNDGKIYFYCNSGTADLEFRDILIIRTSSGAS